MDQPGAIVVMKAGVHGGEQFGSIVARKKREERDCGQAYWGYGGNLCHPTTQVQPLAHRAQGAVRVVMPLTPSTFSGTTTAATEFSTNREQWTRIPPAIRVTSSKYALILRNLELDVIEVDFAAYRIALGPSEGKRLSDYLNGRVDKACAVLDPDADAKPTHIAALHADLVAPYAVFLR